MPIALIPKVEMSPFEVTVAPPSPPPEWIPSELSPAVEMLPEDVTAFEMTALALIP